LAISSVLSIGLCWQFVKDLPITMSRTRLTFLLSVFLMWVLHVGVVGYTFAAVDSYSLSAAMHWATFAEKRRIILRMYLDVGWMTAATTVFTVMSTCILSAGLSSLSTKRPSPNA
jgi:hypothetical protein